MAITPRTVFTNPATAAVAAASLFAMTAAGVAMFSTCPGSRTYEAPCTLVEPTFDATNPCDEAALNRPVERAQWSEYDWFSHANCFARLERSDRVIEEATSGLNYYPTSEALFNLKGYHLIQLGQHAEAVQTLKLGLSRIGNPAQGTLENNLAWSGLWAPRELDIYQARALYKNALRKDRQVCEVIHTGLWVEYGIAKQSQGIERAKALRTFGELREDYAPCMKRYHSGERDQVLEVLSAVVAFEDVDREFRQNALLGQNPSINFAGLSAGSSSVTRKVRNTEQGKSVQEICKDAVPLATAHHTCVDVVESMIKQDIISERIIF